MGAGNLVKQPAWLAEIAVLGILADLGKRHRVQRVFCVKVVDDGGDQHLDCGGGRKPAALQHVAGHAGLPSGQGIAKLLET